ncbi:flagellar hook protein FlgE [Hydrogenovibrio halophilus]|uniref:flagellar hook protein FlgE n=1 Tax=Hydrogenovibrio halophilus TaxID=373391 RepID=UPI00037B58FF|nr:flagellar hook protein FlgE [Hydrogenovibrio halophilus]
MGFPYDLNAVSGINAASTSLGVISNNLANSQTVGFKGSRAEFADMFYGAQSSPGNGVRVSDITQNFTNGTINDTGRELDMAIDGDGFFILEDKTGKYDNVYSRNGSFKLDKEGFITAQEGNRLQGYLLNEEMSTEANPQFDTTLSSINLDALNKTPKATDEMGFNINLDGEEGNNLDPQGTNSGNAADDDSVGSTENLNRLFNPEDNGDFAGFPDFSTNKIIHDSLGGEHRLTANYFKRDVVPKEDDAGNQISTTDADGNTGAAAADAVKYSSWLVQYTVEDYNEETGEWQTSGHMADENGDLVDYDGAGASAAGQVYEMRFDTNGSLLGTYQPDDGAGNYDANQVGGGTITGAANSDETGTAATELDFTKTTQAPKLHFVIDDPLTGATDPLGGEIAATPGTFDIDLDFQEMTQFAGNYNLRGVSQNGYAIGDLVGVTTGLDGVIEARYSNGRSVPVAQLGLADFNDKNALEKLGGQTYAETFASGEVEIGRPQDNGMGTVNAGALEYSNVDTAGELVNMIQTQRTYQASAQVVQTSQTLMQTILQL